MDNTEEYLGYACYFIMFILTASFFGYGISLLFKTEGYNNIFPYSKLQQNIASKGEVLKYPYEDKFHYILRYNLPITNPPFQTVDAGKNFNAKYEKKHYKVYLGKDKKQMEHAGNLERSSDGYHKLTVISSKNYKYGCVSIGDSVVECFKM